jgi:NAD(P)-dependent dehydrogenase (short-subunit alcohol dehydrogenase family)
MLLLTTSGVNMKAEVWIVGASQGLGLAVAEHYARGQIRVVGMARRPQPASDAFESWREIDVTRAESVERAISDLYAEGRSPASIICMASTLYQGPLLGESDERLSAEMETNSWASCGSVKASRVTSRGPSRRASWRPHRRSGMSDARLSTAIAPLKRH